MKIIFDLGEDKSLDINFEAVDENDAITYADLIAAIFTGASSVTKHILSEHTDEEGFETFLFDKLGYLFEAFLQDVFPDIEPEGFGFSDAAMVYAQDKLIEEAFDKGMTYEEVLAEYEEKAKDYVKSKTNVLKC